MINVEVHHIKLLYQLFSLNLKSKYRQLEDPVREFQAQGFRIIVLICFLNHGTTVGITFGEYMFGGKYDNTCHPCSGSSQDIACYSPWVV